MIRILFICHGNICRSTMAEQVMKHMVAQRGIAHDFFIDSAATSTEEIGNPIYPPAARKLRSEGIPVGSHRSRQLRKADYDKFDLLLCADSANIRNSLRILGSDDEGKLRRLLEYTPRPRDIADPWYTGNFDETYEDVREGCDCLLEALGYAKSH